MEYNPTINWIPLQDVYYRRHEYYNLSNLGIDLSKCKVAPCSFGGPIAVIRDYEQLVESDEVGIPDGVIIIFNAAGKKIGQIECEGIDIVSIGWCHEENFVTIQADGTVKIIKLSGRTKTFSLGREAQEFGIKECKVWDYGIVAITGGLHVISVEDLFDPKPLVFKNFVLNELPYSWTVVSPELTLSGHVEILLSIEKTVYSVDVSGYQDQHLQQGPFTHISVSPNGKLVALLQKSGKLQVVSSDFQKLYTETYPLAQTESGKSLVSDGSVNLKSQASDLAWCGNDGVVACYGTSAVLIGPFGGVIKFAFDSMTFLVQEIDGLRFFNNQTHELIQKVPDASVSVFQAGSTSPSALLFDAHDRLKNESSKADEIVRNIGASLGKAIDTCIEAAGYEFNQSLQQGLLRAASFGKNFFPEHNPSKLVDMCTNLRVLNSVREESIGLCVSLQEFQSLPPESWIQRVLNRNMYFMALKLCEHLKVSTTEVYIQWAITKIRQSQKDEDTLYDTLIDKLSDIPSLSYIEIAETARLCGKPRLTARLLQLEPIAANKVPLLLSIGQYNLSLQESINSGNVELVYLVILTTYNELPLGEFFRLVSGNKVASLLFAKYCKQQKKGDLLKNFYFQEDELFGNIELVLTSNLLVEENLTKIKGGIETVIQSLGGDSRHHLQAKALNQELRLLRFQTKLESSVNQSTPQLNIYNLNESGENLALNLNKRLNQTPGNKNFRFVGLTLYQTLSSLVLYGLYSKASLMKSEFSIPEEAFYWIKIKALVKRRDYVELDKLCRAKKPPVGFVAFARECIDSEQFQEASRYIAMCGANDKPDLYFEIGFYHEAAEAALVVKNTSLLRKISQVTNDPTLKADIESRIATI